MRLPYHFYFTAGPVLFRVQQICHTSEADPQSGEIMQSSGGGRRQDTRGTYRTMTAEQLELWYRSFPQQERDE